MDIFGETLKCMTIKRVKNPHQRAINQDNFQQNYINLSVQCIYKTIQVSSPTKALFLFPDQGV